MRFRIFLILLSPFVFSSLAHAQSFDGRYEGNLILTRDGGDCGDKTEKFRAEVKGANIRIFSARADKPSDGKIQSDGQLFASGPGRGGATLEWRAQILATKSGLGSLLIKSGVLCQFLLSLKRE